MVKVTSINVSKAEQERLDAYRVLGIAAHQEDPVKEARNLRDLAWRSLVEKNSWKTEASSHETPQPQKDWIGEGFQGRRTRRDFTELKMGKEPATTRIKKWFSKKLHKMPGSC